MICARNLEILAHPTAREPRSSRRSKDLILHEVRITLEEGSLEAIAQRVAEILAPREENTGQEEPRYLNVAEAAAYLRCTRQRVYDLCSQGSLTRLKDGSRVLLDRTQIDAYLVAGANRRR